MVNGDSPQNSIIFLLVAVYCTINILVYAIKGEDLASPNVVCFYSYSDDLPPEQLNPYYCSHIITFGGISDNYTLTGDTQIISRIQGLKNDNPNLKVLIAIGGQGQNTSISQIVHSSELTDWFIEQSISFLTSNNLDGLDIDWEFPAWGGDPLDSKQLFPDFLQKYKDALVQLSNLTGDVRLILSADVAAPLTIMDASYNITEMAKSRAKTNEATTCKPNNIQSSRFYRKRKKLSVDFVNIMCYDFHFYNWYDRVTGSNAPLFNRSDEHNLFATMNTAWAANEWFERGMPKSKINVGIPTYGHTFQLADPENHGFNALASAPGINDGWINYPQVCSFIQDGGTVVFDEESQVPYAYRDLDWISYDDIQSFTSKTHYILDNEYGGTMIFSINSDDYLGICDGRTRYPMIATVYNITQTYRKPTN